MKNLFKFIAAASALVCAASCAKEISPEGGIEDEAQLVPCTFEASLPDTKATLSNLDVTWQSGDKIAVYDGTAKRQFTLSSGAGTKTAKFYGSVAASATKLSATYPYAAAGDKAGKYIVPKTQNIADGMTIDPSALVMTTDEVSKGSALSFTNACGVARMTVPAGTKDVSFGASDGSYTASFATATAASASVDIVLPPATYKDILVAVTATAGSWVKLSDNDLLITRSAVLKLGDVKGNAATVIRTGSQLKTYLESSSKADAYMVNDIDLSGISLPENASLSAQFNGCGCSIRNAALKTPLFSENNGTIKNVVIDKTCTSTPGKNQFAALVMVNNGTLSNCINKSDIVYEESATTDQVVLGGLVAINKGLVEKCVNEGSVTLTSKGSIRVVCPLLGGVAAFTTGQMTLNTNRGDIEMKLYGSNYAKAGTVWGIVASTLTPGVGGIAGLSYYGKDKTSKGFDGCVNEGDVEVEYTCGVISAETWIRTYVAGICGTAISGYFTNCRNEGDVEVSYEAGKALTTGVKQLYAGGIYNVNTVEYVTTKTCGYPTATKCVNNGDIKLSCDASGSYNYIGGICGASDAETSGYENPEIYACVNNGKIEADGYGKFRAAGISAVAANIISCVNTGKIEAGANTAASTQVGGIVGFANGAGIHSVLNCSSSGDVICLSKNKASVGGIIGEVGGTSTGSTYNGNNVKCNVTCTGNASSGVGMFIGTPKNVAHTLGTETSPNTIRGKITKSAGSTIEITASNFSQYASGVDLTTCSSAKYKFAFDSSKDDPAPTPSEEKICLVDDKYSDYVIVYSSSDEGNATELAAAFRGIFGATLQKAAASSSAKKYEILLGNTGRTESTSLLSLVGTNGYGVKVYGNKLVIAGTDADLQARALYYFEQNVLKNHEYSDDEECELPVSYSYITKNPGPETFSNIISTDMQYSVKTVFIGSCPTQGDCYIAQGIASDGTNVYFTMKNKADTEDVICKYTLSPFGLVMNGTHFNGGHGNDITYDSKNKRLVLAHGVTQGKILSIVDPATLKPANDSVNITVGSGAIAYNAKRDLYAVSQGGSTLYTLNSDFKLAKTYKRTDGRTSTHTAQGMGCDDDYMYFAMSPTSGTGATDNLLVTYDWNGKYLGDIHIPLTMEAESMICVNGKYYVNFYSEKSSKLYQIIPTITYKY